MEIQCWSSPCFWSCKMCHLQNSSPWNPSLPWNSKMLPIVWAWIFFWNHPMLLTSTQHTYTLHTHSQIIWLYSPPDKFLIKFSLPNGFYCRYLIRIQKLFDGFCAAWTTLFYNDWVSCRLFLNCQACTIVLQQNMMTQHTCMLALSNWILWDDLYRMISLEKFKDLGKRVRSTIK